MSIRTVIVGIPVPTILWPDELRPYVDHVLAPHGLTLTGLRVGPAYFEKVEAAATVYARCQAGEGTAAMLLDGRLGFSDAALYDRPIHGGETEWQYSRAWVHWVDVVGASSWPDAMRRIGSYLGSILLAPVYALWMMVRHGVGPVHVIFSFALVVMGLVDSVRRLQVMRRITRQKKTAP
ncbi:hypothetical protein HY633_04730 [Candidatus Uhrbacteria bacterium]|nr:hypothetical protein [Candidatus Uhrbacteria bacterium]